METYGVIAQFEPHPDRYTVWSNFQGPFVLQPLMAGALGVAGNRLRLVTPPNSGGSFGIKQAVYSYMVLIAAVSRLVGVPVKWTEDRLEHLMASSSATDRTGDVEAAFSNDGELLGLRYRNVVNLGAYIRAPEPASVYRMHSTSSGAYRVKNLAVDNTLVVTNRMPAGLNRGYGGPQFYFALERIMEIAARGLGIDVAELRRRNLVRKDDFPYDSPAGSQLDSGDYEACLDEVLRLAEYPALLARRESARKAGRLFGIGFALGVEPSGSNMAYVGLAQTAEQRGKAEPKSGANAAVTISIDPSGGITVQLDSTPNGQGPCHGRGADRRRRAWRQSRGRGRADGSGHAHDCVEHRLGQLLEPLRVRRDERGAGVRAHPRRQVAAHGRRGVRCRRRRRGTGRRRGAPEIGSAACGRRGAPRLARPLEPGRHARRRERRHDRDADSRRTHADQPHRRRPHRLGDDPTASSRTSPRSRSTAPPAASRS